MTTNMSAGTTPLQRAPRPWYREPWPWLLMAGPFIVVVAALFTAWLAVTTSDGLVTDDYYKQGQMVGETLARSRHAEATGLRAAISFGQDGNLRVRLESTSEITMPAALLLSLSHPTRARVGLDQHVSLRRDGDGYSGEIKSPAPGHWMVLIEDAEKTWRLVGSIMLPAGNETVIGG